jgi:dolichol kinase
MATAMMPPPMTAAAFTYALEELREFLTTMQRPRLSDAQWVRNAQDRAQELQTRFAEARQSVSTRSQELSGAIEETMDGLREWRDEFLERPRKRRLRYMTRRLSFRYETLVRAARSWMDEAMESVETPSTVKPANYMRNVFHVGMGVVSIVLVELLLSWTACVWVTASVAVIAMSLEISRRYIPAWNAILVRRVFGAISRPREMYRINGATWYTLAILTVLLAFPLRAAELGVIILALADPAATLAGRRWGQTRIWQDKSVIGAGAFFGVAWAAAFLFSVIVPGGPADVVSRLTMATVVALVGVAAEVFTEQMDDNFTIPVLCAGVASFWWVAA